MAKKKNVATTHEVLAAQAFLRTLGANWRDTYLVLAIIAWVRVAIALHHGKYNNIFGLKPGAYDKAFRSGIYTTTGPFQPHTGRPTIQLSKYASLSKALQAFAVYLRTQANSTNGFRLILSAIRHDRPSDVLWAASMSSIDPSHYGLGTTQLLFVEYSSFTGIAQPGHPGTPGRPPTVKPAKIAPPPRSLQAPVVHPHYVNAYAVQSFYDERHDKVAPEGPNG